LKPSTPFVSAAALLGAVLFAAAAAAPAPQSPPAESAPPHEHGPFPAPTNLKVLPRNLTGDQVHEIMRGWAAALGVHCSRCHVEIPGQIGPDGKPRLNFADDSKQEKSTARSMVTMTEEINRKYITKIENTEVPVSCGTCHRGHFDPQAFVPADSPTQPTEVPPPAGKKPQGRG
jgi:hypothetical protein